MLYINQRNYPDIPYITKTECTGEDYEKGQHTTVKSSGCGLCSAIMALDRLLVKYTFGLEDAVNLSYEVKANNGRGTNYGRFAPAFAEKFNLKLQMTNEVEDLIACLKTGGAAVANVGGDREGHTGVFSHTGHYVAVIGIESDGRLAVLDPGYVENKYEEDGRQGKVEMKNGIIALCTANVLAEDTVNRHPAFYLFWRK